MLKSLDVHFALAARKKMEKWPGKKNKGAHQLKVMDEKLAE